MEATVEQKLKSLFYLQLIDNKIYRIQNVRGELPMEVSDLEDELAGLNTRIDNLKKEAEAVKAGIDENKAAIKTANGLITKYETQQTNVKNNREYLALTKEVEMQKLEIMASEKKIKEFQGQIEFKKEQLESTKKQLEERKSDLDHKKDELANITKETQKEEDYLTEKREESSATIDERLRNAYNKVRLNVKNRLAVVTIDRDACAGCFSKIPPQRQLDIRQRKKIIVCENCGRIIVDNELADEVKVQLEEAIGEITHA